VSVEPDLPAAGYVNLAGLGAHDEEAIHEECERRQWPLVELASDEAAGQPALERPGLRRCLERIADGSARALVVARLEVLPSAVPELAALLDWVETAGAIFICLDPGVDTGTRAGRLAHELVARLASSQREQAAERTRMALARARRAGRPVGRPSVADRPQLRDRIARMRADGMTLQAIADALNAEGVPTLRGGAQWRASSVQGATGYRRRGRPHRPPRLPALPPPPRGRRHPPPAGRRRGPGTGPPAPLRRGPGR
jgi:DNA invertase Pin-like site-specific DNA recombinase